MDPDPKEIGFSKGNERYNIRYTEIRDLIHCLVDYAEDPRYNLDLMDVFVLIHRIAYLHGRRQRHEAPQ